MKKKITILCIFVMLTSMLTACHSDSPAEMFGRYQKHLEETGDMLDALGKYSADYGLCFSFNRRIELGLSRDVWF